MGIEPIKMRKRRARTVMRTLDTKSKPKRPQISKRLSKEANNIIVSTIDVPPGAADLISIFFSSLPQTIQCDLCKNRKKIILWKKSADFNDERVQRQNKQMAVKPIEQPMIIFDNVPHDVTDHASKKRKHKKDKTAGLLYTINKNDKQLQKVVETRKTGTALIAPASKKAGKNKSKLTTSGGQKPKVKMANVMAPSHISKKPSILQLANALKKKNAEPTTTAEQLKKMLN